jgi:hypothetical protein
LSNLLSNENQEKYIIHQIVGISYQKNGAHHVIIIEIKACFLRQKLLIKKALNQARSAKYMQDMCFRM